MRNYLLYYSRRKPAAIQRAQNPVMNENWKVLRFNQERGTTERELQAWLRDEYKYFNPFSFFVQLN